MIPLGIGGFIVVALLSMFTGVDFFSMLGGGSGGSSQPTAVGTSGKATTGSPTEEKMVDMVDAVATDVQQTWSRLLGGRYQQTKVTLFRDAIQSGCGYAGAVSGPFYCPGDRKVYIDLSFFDELHAASARPATSRRRMSWRTRSGTTCRRSPAPRRASARHSDRIRRTGTRCRCAWSCRPTATPASGATMHRSRTRGPRPGRLDPGDLEEGLGAAAAIGDDRLQKLGTGRVQPETFTHGSSQQRQEWFKRGFDTGDPRQCDTFGK